jgi:hypothetical protein
VAAIAVRTGDRAVHVYAPRDKKESKLTRHHKRTQQRSTLDAFWFKRCRRKSKEAQG